jgi:hypothetical protein
LLLTMHRKGMPKARLQLSAVGISNPYKGLDCGRFEFVQPRNLLIADGILSPSRCGVRDVANAYRRCE